MALDQKFIHYGHDCFCRYRFQGVYNGPPGDTKPAKHYDTNGKRGGLWGSPFAAGGGLSWRQWWEQHNRRTLRQTWFLFWFKPAARILQIENPGDVADWIRSECPLNSLDFERIGHHFDAVAVNIETIKALASTTFSGWECDTIIVLNPKIVLFDPD